MDDVDKVAWIAMAALGFGIGNAVALGCAFAHIGGNKDWTLDHLRRLYERLDRHDKS